MSIISELPDAHRLSKKDFASYETLIDAYMFQRVIRTLDETQRDFWRLMGFARELFGSTGKYPTVGECREESKRQKAARDAHDLKTLGMTYNHAEYL